MALAIVLCCCSNKDKPEQNSTGTKEIEDGVVDNLRTINR